MQSTTYLDQLLQTPDMVRPIISPNGKWVAWTWYQIGEAAEVYAVEIEKLDAFPVRLTSSTNNSILVSWAPDSSSVIISQDQGGNERSQLFLVELKDPCKLTPITQPNPNYYIRGGFLHPDKKWLIYGANFNFEINQEIESTWIYKENLETGEKKLLSNPERTSEINIQMSTDGNFIIYTCLDEKNPISSQIWLTDINGIESRKILDFGSNIKVKATWFPNEYSVLFTAQYSTHTRLGKYEILRNQTTWLVDNPTRNIDYAFIPNNCRKAVIIEIDQARFKSYLFDLKTKDEVHIHSNNSDFIPLSPISKNESTWVGYQSSSCQPTDLIVISLTSSTVNQIRSLSKVWNYTFLSKDSLVPAQDFWWRSVDGLEIQGWLYLPKCLPLGTIVIVHGGPTFNSQNRFDEQIQFYVDQGFVVLSPNYRGSTGFGIEFQELIKKTAWGGKEQEDIRTGIEALIDRGISKPGKVGITGTSYGGYSSWIAITRFPIEVVAASVPICGMTDLTLDYETTRPDLRFYSQEMMGGTPENLPDLYYQRSPINFVQQIKGKVLIVHGIQDPNVSYKNVQNIEAALKKFNIPYQTLFFEDEGHGIFKPANRRVLYLEVARFFREVFSS